MSTQVRVLTVELRDFRSYTRADARLGEGLTVVHGPNGAGKSNLLEALYFGCTARSPRTRSDRELVRFGADTTRVVVAVEAEGRRHELAVAFGAPGPGAPAVKRTTCDGALVERPLELPMRPLLSVFMPDRLELVKGPPGVRRAHLDSFVAGLWPGRAAARVQYARALAQRNALLARVRGGDASPATLSAWDRELSAAAAELQAHRRDAVALLERPFAELAEALGLSGASTISYRPRSSSADADGFLAELAERHAADVERGFTGHGPHRDELLLARDGRELRVYGSQGEQRLALLALLLAERSILARESGRVPLMLLDDVMSELDPARRLLLAEQLSAGGQSVIATTDLAQVPSASDGTVTRLRVSPGAILQEALAA